MSNSQHTEYQGVAVNFKIGILKELHKRQLITRDEMERAIKSINGKND